MGYVLRDDQYWPTGDVVPGHSSWRSERARAGGGALLEHSIHSADILTWLFGAAARVYARTRHDVRLRRRGRGRVHRRARVRRRRHAAHDLQRRARARGAAARGVLRARRGRGHDRLPRRRARRQLLDPATRCARRSGSTWSAMREQHFAAAGIERRDFMVYLYPAARSFVRRCGTGRPRSPGFGDALRAHALVEAAYRRPPAGQPSIDRRSRRRFVVDLTEVDDVVQVEDAVQHREHRRIEVRRGSEMRVHVERTVTRRARGGERARSHRPNP